MLRINNSPIPSPNGVSSPETVGVLLSPPVIGPEPDSSPRDFRITGQSASSKASCAVIGALPAVAREDDIGLMATYANVEVATVGCWNVRCLTDAL